MKVSAVHVGTSVRSHPLPRARRQAKRRIAYGFIAAALLVAAPRLFADVGIIVYQSKGSEARRTSAGHVAIIATDLCANGISALRECRPGEAPGAVIHHYPDIATGYGKSTIVVPLLDHLVATRDPRKIPVVTSGGTLEAMQVAYWRQYLRQYLPPLTPQQYKAIRAQDKKFDAARMFRRIISLEFIGTLLGADSKHYPTEPFAIPDPVTGELIPDGRWREVIGVSHQRGLVIIVARARPDQERRLIDYIREPKQKPFNSLTSNCSDFVKGGLLAVFSDTGLRFRPRYMEFANAWISAPISVATDFVHYIVHNRQPAQVAFIPMLAGSRRPTLGVTSLARGALIPNPEQGKIAFGVKIFVNVLNPLLITSAFSADAASRFINLQKLVHERSGGNLSLLANELAADPKDKTVLRAKIRREQIRVYGTPACWKQKQDRFRAITNVAQNRGLLRLSDAASLLKSGRPFLLARHYEDGALALNQGGNLMAVIQPGPQGSGIQVASLSQSRNPLLAAQSCLSAVCPRDLQMSFLPSSTAGERDGTWHPETIPGRDDIRSMAESGMSHLQSSAFRLMTTLMNYDLTSDPIDRTTAQRFDQDWQLFLETAERSGVDDGPEQASVEACSSLEFEDGTARTDAFEKSIHPPAYVLRQLRTVVYSPMR